MIVIRGVGTLVPMGNGHVRGRTVEQAFTLLLRQHKVDRSIEPCSVTTGARQMTAREKRHHCKTGHSRLTAFQRRERSIGLLLRCQPGEAAVDTVVNILPLVD